MKYVDAFESHGERDREVSLACRTTVVSRSKFEMSRLVESYDVGHLDTGQPHIGGPRVVKCNILDPRNRYLKTAPDKAGKRFCEPFQRLGIIPDVADATQIERYAIALLGEQYHWLV
jgi:hypothetical protein